MLIHSLRKRTHAGTHIMSEIITKGRAALDVIEDSSYPAWQRVWKSHSLLSSVKNSDLTPVTSVEPDKHVVEMNEITADYGIDTSDDCEQLSDTDATSILNHIRTSVQLCIDSEAGRIIKELGTADLKLPVAAIKEVREHRDELAPHLIASLQSAIAKARNEEEAPKEDASFFAVFLLVEMKVEEAYPVILDLFRLPGTQAERVFADGAFELAGPILAQCSQGDIGVIEGILGDRKIDMFQRWSVAHTYNYLVRDKTIEREQAIDSLMQLFETSLSEEDHDMLAPLACELSDLAAEDSLTAIRSAFQRGLADESMVKLSEIESNIVRGEERIQQTLSSCRPTGIQDTIEELSGWASFKEDTTRPSKPPIATTAVPRPHVLPNDMPASTPIATRSNEKVGRNDPCPCGSGKKSKKCCR